jgi:hypothetical protein
MKIIKFTLICAAVTMYSGFAFGQTVNVHLTGSTAYRANVYRAIQAILQPGFTLAYDGAGPASETALEGSGHAIFVGTLASASHAPVRIKTSFSGSEAGIQAVGKGTAIAFFIDTQPTSVFPGTAGASTAGHTESAEIDMADTQQAASNYLGPFQGFTYPALTENSNSPVGVVPFKFYGAPATTLTNVTAQQCRALYENNGGSLPLSFFTGNSADLTTTVVATGRDNDSGTRATLFAETGIGSRTTANGNAAPFVANTRGDTNEGDVITTAGGAIDHFNVYPAGTVNGIALAAGDNGYHSGGTLAKALNNTVPAGTQFIGYASTNDGDPQLSTRPGHPGTGITELSFNGVTMGGGTTSTYDYNTNTNLTGGTYTYWGYEHMYMGSAATGTILTTANDLASNIKTSNAICFLTNMHAFRTNFVDGATILPQ